MFKEYRNWTIKDDVDDAWYKNLTSQKSLVNVLPEWMRFDSRLETIKLYLNAGANIADMGSGTGEWVAKLTKSGYKCCGVDFSLDLCQYAKAKWPDYNFIHSDIRKTPLNDNALDGVISWGVVEHDEMGLDAAFKEFGRIIRSGGYAIITVPYDDSNARAMSAHQHPKEINSQFFQYFFNEIDICKAGSANSFELVEWSKTGPAAFAKWSPSLYDVIKKNTMALRVLLFIFTIFDPQKRLSLMGCYVLRNVKQMQ